MTKKITHEQLKQVIRVLYECPDRDGKKIPAMCYGTFGIGKCLDGETLLFTDKGFKKLKDINKGEKVLSYDFKNNKETFSICTDKFVSKKETKKIVCSDGTELISSEEHFFFVEDKGWMKAKDLKVDDTLIVYANQTYEQGRKELLSRNNRWRRNNNFNNRKSSKKSSISLSNINYIQLINGINEMDNEKSKNTKKKSNKRYSSIKRENQDETSSSNLSNTNCWEEASLPFVNGIKRIFDNKKTSSRTINQIYGLSRGKMENSFLKKEKIHSKGYRDVLEIKENEFKRITIKEIYRTTKNKKLLFDISTTEHNYIANGIIVHNSMGIKQVAKMLAALLKKKFVEWNLLTYEEKIDIVNNVRYKEFFIFFDIRLAEFDATDIKGVPDLNQLRRWIEWKYPFFVEVLQHPDSDGILFFDEITHAPDLTLKSCYKIIHDKVINDVKINYNWLILAAGNLETDMSNIQELYPPLKDRLCEFELMPPSNREWIKWAISVKMHPKIIAYHTWKGDMLRKVNYKDGQKFTTERGWERIDAIMHRPIQDIELMSGTLIGEGVAIEYVDFLKLQEKVNLDEIIQNPEKIKEVKDVGQRYFVISGLAEKYANDEMEFVKIFAISSVLDSNKGADFVTLLWKLCSKQNKVKFRKDFLTKELNHPLREKFVRYMGDD